MSMQACRLRGLTLLVFSGVALSTSIDKDARLASGETTQEQPVMRKDPFTKHVQVGPHGSFVDNAKKKATTEQSLKASNAALTQEGKLTQKRTKEEPGPKIVGYGSSDCGGDHSPANSFELPSASDYRVDHCLETKNPDTKAPNGRIRISCDSEALAAKVCIWHDANDTACELAEPFCLVMQQKDLQLVNENGCVPVTEIPGEKSSFAKWSDWPEDTAWPDCLMPPMTQGLMIKMILCGVGVGCIVLCGIWFAFFAPKGHHGPEKGGHGEGEGQGEGEAYAGEDDY